jgi:malonyl-ACP decarboxylase
MANPMAAGRTPERVVVTGIGVCTAAARGLDDFARLLIDGRPPAGGAGAFRMTNRDFPRLLDDLGLPGAIAERARASARRAPFSLQLSVATAAEAWYQAGLDQKHGYAPEAISLIVAGANMNLDYAWELAEAYRSRLEFVPPSHALHYMDTDQVGAISETFGIRGEGFTIGGASASGNVGLLQGLRLLRAGQSEVCLVAGAMTDLSPLELSSFQNTGAMSPDGICRPFDRNRTGFVYGHGSAALVLETERGAVSRGRPFLGILLGGAACLDGNRSSDPSCEGEARVMRAALTDAGVDVGAVDYVNAHGTGSVLGDAVECEAIRNVFGERFPKVWLNSTKGITGHCLTAAGIVEAVAVLIQLTRGFLHPNAGLVDPIDADARFVTAESQTVGCRTALSNGFGFGGINTALVFERS